MSNEMTPYSPQSALSLPSDAQLNTLERIAKHVAKTSLVKRRISESDAMMIMLKGYALGIDPVEAVSQIYIVDGVPSTSVQLMLALANRSGLLLSLQIPDTAQVAQNDSATVTAVRRDRPNDVYKGTFTMAEARKANLANKSNWKNYAPQMLINRAVSICLRRAVPEALSGMYTVEEIDATIQVDHDGKPLDNSTNDAVDAVIIEDGQTPMQPPKPAQNATQGDTATIDRQWSPTDDDITQLQNSAKQRFNMTPDGVVKALGMVQDGINIGFADWRGTKAEAIAAIVAFGCIHNKDKAMEYINAHAELNSIRAIVARYCDAVDSKSIDRENNKWTLDSIYLDVMKQLDQKDKFSHVKNWLNWLDKHYPDEETELPGSPDMHNPRTDLLERSYSDALEMLVSKRKATQAHKRGEQETDMSEYEMQEIPFA